MLEAWLGLERRVEIAGRNGNFWEQRVSDAGGRSWGWAFFLLAVLHGIQGLSSLTRD